MLVCLLLKRTSGHFNSKGFRRNLFLKTRATQKEQATTSLKTNFLNVNRVEYIQDLKPILQTNSKGQTRRILPLQKEHLRFRQSCGLFCDLRVAACTPLDFSNSLSLSFFSGYFSVSVECRCIYCAENWKLLLPRTLLHFFLRVFRKIWTKGGQVPT